MCFSFIIPDARCTKNSNLLETIMKGSPAATAAAFLLLAFDYASRLGCQGHAIFWEPPSRASLGKHNMNFCQVPINDDHMSVYCGGIQVRILLLSRSVLLGEAIFHTSTFQKKAQHQQYDGKCGICGDPYGDEQQPHRYPGKYATGIIGRSYFAPGQV